MTAASVGFHCPECTKAGAQVVRTGASLFQARPYVTQALVTLNVAVFVVSVAKGDGLLSGEIAGTGLLIRGADNGLFIDLFGEWYRTFTSGFLHYGVIHLTCNMYALWHLGLMLERSIGPARFALTYVACLTGGSFGALLVTPNGFTVGASGAIFGLLAVALVSYRSLTVSIWDGGLGATLVLNILLTFGIRYLSVGGHLGGFAMGLACGWLIYEAPRQRQFPRGTVEAAMVGLGALGFVAAQWAAATWSNPILG